MLKGEVIILIPKQKPKTPKNVCFRGKTQEKLDKTQEKLMTRMELFEKIKQCEGVVEDTINEEEMIKSY